MTTWSEIGTDIISELKKFAKWLENGATELYKIVEELWKTDWVKEINSVDPGVVKVFGGLAVIAVGVLSWPTAILGGAIGWHLMWEGYKELEHQDQLREAYEEMKTKKKVEVQKLETMREQMRVELKAMEEALAKDREECAKRIEQLKKETEQLKKEEEAIIIPANIPEVEKKPSKPPAKKKKAKKKTANPASVNVEKISWKG